MSKVLDAMDSGVAILSRDCEILMMNDAAKEYIPEGAAPASCKDSFARAFTDLCSRCPNNKSGTRAEQSESIVTDARGLYYSARFKTIELGGNKTAVALFMRNINDEHSTKENLYSLAYVDHLTGIANRSKLVEDFNAIEDRIVESKAVGAVALFDLDYFKTLNDSYGHNTGDIMLKRLTGYLESEEAYRGHLYRIGGDEFIFVFSEPSSRFRTKEECREYFNELLSDTLHYYTLPNMDAGCTLSMGIALFPWHGQELSDLQRKADIALYKAKERGRNQICFFEEAFNTAQKFRDIYITIQPILTLEGTTYGYELVDQSSKSADVEGTLNLNDFNRTLEALELDDFESTTLYFINYSNQLLNHAIAAHLPSNKFIIDIRLSGRCSPADIKKFADLRAYGYALRFFGLNPRNASPDLLRLATYCSFDRDESDDGFRDMIIAQNPSIKFIATEVDTPAQYEAAVQKGFTLFQGYYFRQLDVVKKIKEIDQLKINYLRLLKLTSTNETVDFKEISSIISSDVALTYRLLRLLNSAAIGLRNPISSISLAVAYLGEVNLRKWIAMLALRGVAEDKPLELVRLSLIRARFGELLCETMKPERDPKQVFLLGMLSLLDVALEKTKEEVFSEIPVADEIRESLLTDNGPYSDLIAFFTDYEYVRWEKVEEFSAKNMLTDNCINSAYITAVKWYNDMLNFE